MAGKESAMPLRDHFRPPVSKRSSWEGFHGMWPGTMVQQLDGVLPGGFVAEPRVHLGTFYEIDVCTFEEDRDWEESSGTGRSVAEGGVATATWAPPAPSVVADLEFPEQYAYEVLIFDVERERRLVAAIETVSPANKDRPDSRHLFVAKCANLLQKGVCVSIVDLVTIRRFNLYVELLTLLGTRDRAFAPDPPPTYAATCRNHSVNGKTRLETWSSPLAVGQPLPAALPIWLTETQAVSLDLEASYEAACRGLRIG
jgi:hypothetical protein